MPLFEPIDSFEVEYVRIRATKTRWLVDTVIEDDELPIRRIHRRVLQKLLEQLVIAIHEIDLEALCAHRGVAVEHTQPLFSVHQLRPCGPQYDIDALLPCVSDDTRNVHFVARFIEVELLRPPLIHDDVGDAIRCREVDILLVRLKVAARLESGNVCNPESVPPVPRNLSRLHPRGIGNAARIGDRIDNIRRNEVRRAVPDYEYPPRERARPLRFREIRTTCLDIRHATSDIHLVRNPSLPRAKSIRFVIPSEEA